jgi:hypothetical protein
MPKPKLDVSSKIQVEMLAASIAALVLTGLVNFLWVLGTWLIVMYLLLRLNIAAEALQRAEVEQKRLQYLAEHPRE